MQRIYLPILLIGLLVTNPACKNPQIESDGGFFGGGGGKKSKNAKPLVQMAKDYLDAVEGKATIPAIDDMAKQIVSLNLTDDQLREQMKQPEVRLFTLSSQNEAARSVLLSQAQDILDGKKIPTASLASSETGSLSLVAGGTGSGEETQEKTDGSTPSSLDGATIQTFSGNSGITSVVFQAPRSPANLGFISTLYIVGILSVVGGVVLAATAGSNGSNMSATQIKDAVAALEAQQDQLRKTSAALLGDVPGGTALNAVLQSQGITDTNLIAELVNNPIDITKIDAKTIFPEPKLSYATEVFKKINPAQMQQVFEAASGGTPAWDPNKIDDSIKNLFADPAKFEALKNSMQTGVFGNPATQIQNSSGQLLDPDARWNEKSLSAHAESRMNAIGNIVKSLPTNSAGFSFAGELLDTAKSQITNLGITEAASKSVVDRLSSTIDTVKKNISPSSGFQDAVKNLKDLKTKAGTGRNPFASKTGGRVGGGIIAVLGAAAIVMTSLYHTNNLNLAANDDAEISDEVTNATETFLIGVTQVLDLAPPVLE